MQVASLHAATSKLQQNISQLPEMWQRGRNWALSPICQSNRCKHMTMAFNSIQAVQCLQLKVTSVTIVKIVKLQNPKTSSVWITFCALIIMLIIIIIFTDVNTWDYCGNSACQCHVSDQLVDCFWVPIVTIPDTDLHFANFRSPGNEVPVG